MIGEVAIQSVGDWVGVRGGGIAGIAVRDFVRAGGVAEVVRAGVAGVGGDYGGGDDTMRSVARAGAFCVHGGVGGVSGGGISGAGVHFSAHIDGARVYREFSPLFWRNFAIILNIIIDAFQVRAIVRAMKSHKFAIGTLHLTSIQLSLSQIRKQRQLRF